MDLRLTASEEAFRARLETWLEEVQPPEGMRDYGATPTADDIATARRWHRALLDGGWAALSWPEPYGAGASAVEQAIFAEAMARRALPRQLSFVSMELAGPILIGFGTEAQKERFLDPLKRGDEIWCQLFSEPGAGSDLASISTRASARSGGWVVTGQKVWTSGAHYADYGLLLARTSPDAPVHRGITCFALPMDRPGIEVRPIVQMDEESKFNEVFLDDVEVSEADVLGVADGGWKVALSILGRERRMLGSIAIGLATTLTELRDEVARLGMADASFQQRWAELYIRVQLLRWTWFRLLASSSDSATDPRMSVLKLVSSELQQAVGRLGMEALPAELVQGADGARWRQRFLASFGATIAGGTSEIQRNILGERVLGLAR